MTLPEHHKQYLLRLSLLSAVFVLVMGILRFFPWADDINPIYFYSLTASLSGNILALIYFSIRGPRKNTINFEKADALGLLSRNAYIFAALFFLTAFMTMSTAAGRISYFFFLLATLALPFAHICYGIWIKKIEKMTN